MKNEIMFDFAVNMPRVIVGGGVAILDYVKRIVTYSQEKVIVHNGSMYTWIEGKGLVIKEMKDERMMITGEVEQIRFVETLYQDKA